MRQRLLGRITRWMRFHLHAFGRALNTIEPLFRRGTAVAERGGIYFETSNPKSLIYSSRERRRWDSSHCISSTIHPLQARSSGAIASTAAKSDDVLKTGISRNWCLLWLMPLRFQKASRKKYTGIWAISGLVGFLDRGRIEIDPATRQVRRQVSRNLSDFNLSMRR